MADAQVSVSPPPEEVLRAFAVAGPLHLLSGGRGTCWRVGDTVLKPLDTPEAALAWQEQALRSMPVVPEFRVAAPVRSRGQRLVVSGWTAWPLLAGRHVPGWWPQIVAAGRRFHAAAESVPRPSFLDDRTDRWAAGDRVAWGESPIEPYLELDTVADLVAVLRPVSARPQLIHGDLTGNVLFHNRLPPAIIDLSPYWRPSAYADAIVVADALAWEGAGVELVAAVGAGVPEFGQCLLRALIYRIVTDRLARGDRVDDWQAPYRPVVRAACDLAASQTG